jgi:hypothetical protein
MATSDQQEPATASEQFEWKPAPARPAPDALLVSLGYRDSSPKMKAFLDYLADRPNQWISSREIGAAIDYKWPQVAGMLGAFGRRWEHRYRGVAAGPFQDKWNGVENHQDYLMISFIAAIIRETRGGS